ncbi:hypothetical protein PCAR4_570206 [Paraburkholderia caribensis]|nr:hypothetical protein PCAR4_570206 [Paraburkholderia caribensis]
MLGLLNGIFPPESLLEVARSHATALAKLPEEVIQKTKCLIQDGLELLAAIQFAAERDAFTAAISAPAAQQAFAKFLDKRGAK